MRTVMHTHTPREHKSAKEQTTTQDTGVRQEAENKEANSNPRYRSTGVPPHETQHKGAKTGVQQPERLRQSTHPTLQ